MTKFPSTTAGDLLRGHIDMADRMRLKRTEIEAYYERIAFPQDRRIFEVTSLSDDEKITYLKLLKKHHIVTIPFENLSLHYSWHRVVHVQPRHLFNKVVANKDGRGGYCMEVNSLFHVLLLSLGYNVFMAGARVYSPARQAYGGFSHCVNIVRTSNTQYLVDVGFGANGPSSAIPLHTEQEHSHVGPARMRLVRESLAQYVNQDCKVWIYQHKIDEGASWVPMYSFVDFEFIPDDICCINLGPSTMTTSWFTQKIVVTRFTTAAERDVRSEKFGYTEELSRPMDQISGTLIINHDQLKWRHGGHTILNKEFRNDQERIDALQQYFGIVLSTEDREAIRGAIGQVAGQIMPISISTSSQCGRNTNLQDGLEGE